MDRVLVEEAIAGVKRRWDLAFRVLVQPDFVLDPSDGQGSVRTCCFTLTFVTAFFLDALSVPIALFP